jgi:tetratricopeptide (TPR) repeat protein
MAKRVRPRAGLNDRKPSGSAVSAQAGQSARATAPAHAQVSALPAPSADAVAVFERGMQALQRHAFAQAAEQFRSLLDMFPGERGLRDRSQVYLCLCDRELKRQPAAPRTVEERLTAATAALNDGDDKTAERLARSVLDDVSGQELALYLLAAVEARRGSSENALEWLARAIDASPEIRAQARHDADFEELRGLDAFRQLIDMPANLANARRSRARGRAER